jgi:predicted nucleic acid-binding protein
MRVYLDTFEEMAALAVEAAQNTESVAALADAYIAVRTIGAGQFNDALHIALATVARCDALLSWDVQHIVTDWRIERYSSVNGKRKYSRLTIQTPVRFMQGRKRKR